MTTAGYWLLLSLCAVGAEAEPLVLYDFEDASALTTITTTDAKVKLVPAATGQALEVELGHDREWPGITLKGPEEPWDLSPYAMVAVDVTNLSAKAATLSCRVDNDGADGTNNCCNGNISLDPGASGMLQVTLAVRRPEVAGLDLFGMRGSPVSSGTRGVIDPSKVTQILLFVGRPAEATAWRIDDVRAVGQAPAVFPTPTADGFMPFVDTFGQYRHRDWPGKVQDLADLRGRVSTEAADLAAHPAPANWDRWGGWADGPKQQATGFFRVAKVDGMWWLIDPDGNLFWSHGIDCVGSWHYTPTDQRETWWQDFPGGQPDLAEFAGGPWRALHGHYAGQQVRGYSFSLANLKRKYGADWKVKWYDLAHDRLRSWGANTIGNWSQAEIQRLRRTPYVATVGTGGKILAGSTGYWGQFKDVFDPSFAESIKQTMERQKGGAAGDPWCIGFFVDNEIAWGDDTSLALAALTSPAGQAAKLVFIDDLKATYQTIDRLNAAWGTNHASWQALVDSTDEPEKDKARADLNAFYSKFAAKYFETIRDAVKAAAPNQLYLGCRFAWVNDLAAQQAAKYCDIVSYNLYRRGIADFQTNAGDVPLIVGEFHFGALDRGMFHTGLVPVADQAERAAMYRSYVEGALRHPQFVGTHWFEYQDEPLTGRWLDEENYQIGFIDQADSPYPEIVAAARAVGAEMYDLRASAEKK